MRFGEVLREATAKVRAWASIRELPSAPILTYDGFRIEEAPIFYNYTFFTQVQDLDLLNVAAELLSSGISKFAYLPSQRALIYQTEESVQTEILSVEGRRRENYHSTNLPDDIPEEIIPDVLSSLEEDFHERKFQATEGGFERPYLRFTLPSLRLDDDETAEAIHLNVDARIYIDGIATVSFVLDGAFNRIPVRDFIRRYVNLYRRYFTQIYLDVELQRLDLETNSLFDWIGEMWIPGAPPDLAPEELEELQDSHEEMVAEGQEYLEEEGETIEFPDGREEFVAPVNPEDDDEEYELDLGYCRRVYANALSVIVGRSSEDWNSALPPTPIYWVGRPNVVLLNYQGQASVAEDNVRDHQDDIHQILARSAALSDPSKLAEMPPDLRPFGDSSLFITRSVILWVWADRNLGDREQRSRIIENQARIQHIEYMNMRFKRLQHKASEIDEVGEAHDVLEELSTLQRAMHEAGAAGEISDALEYALDTFGTIDLNEAAEKRAERRLQRASHERTEKRIETDRALTAIFAVVGAAGLAQFISRPAILFLLTLGGLDEATLMSPLGTLLVNLAAFSLAGLVVWAAYRLLTKNS